jgi:hypothetical protein
VTTNPPHFRARLQKTPWVPGESPSVTLNSRPRTRQQSCHRKRIKPPAGRHRRTDWPQHKWPVQAARSVVTPADQPWSQSWTGTAAAWSAPGAGPLGGVVGVGELRREVLFQDLHPLVQADEAGGAGLRLDQFGQSSMKG